MSGCQDFGNCSECDKLCEVAQTYRFCLAVGAHRRMCSTCYTRAVVAHVATRGWMTVQQECAELALQLSEAELEKSQHNQMRRPDPLFNKSRFSRAEKSRRTREWFGKS